MTGAGNLEPQDCYSATALMQLGGRDLSDVSGGNVNTVAVNGQPDVGQLDSSQLGAVGMQWPILFDMGQGGAGT